MKKVLVNWSLEIIGRKDMSKDKMAAEPCRCYIKFLYIHVDMNL